MTVRELIAALDKIEDKDKKVFYYIDGEPNYVVDVDPNCFDGVLLD